MKTKALISSMLTALCLIVSMHSIQAQQTVSVNDVPRTISYQGLLTNIDGVPVADGKHEITVSLYADPAGSVKVWQGTYTTLVLNGIFNLYLGDEGQPLPDVAAMNRSLWIGTAIGNASEMRPLSLLSASPYALNVPDRAITTGKLADGAVTAEKVAMDYVAAIEIDDEKVAGAGTVLKLKSSDDIKLEYDGETNSSIISSRHVARGNTEGDSEKNGEVPTVLDATDASNNWLGRNAGGNQPFYDPFIGSYNTLAGGFVNTIGAASDYSALVGGASNGISSSVDHAFLGGGSWNMINSNANHSFLGGGFENEITGSTSALVGGEANSVIGNYSFLGGGHDNSIRSRSEFNVLGGGEGNLIGYNTSADWATISGGRSNLISSHHSTIGGGRGNLTTGEYSTIPGGYYLNTTVFAQTAVGYLNAPRGSISSPPNAATTAATDDPLFMVGNGDGTVEPQVRSNAFEVSNNGHSVVYDVNGSSQAIIPTNRVPYRGATYVDNVIYAWGNITGGGFILADFGVLSVTHTLNSGIYDIRIQVNDPVTGNPITLTDASVTATLKDAGDDTPCLFLTASSIGTPAPNTFRVRIQDMNCVEKDAHFMFKVTGRP